MGERIAFNGSAINGLSASGLNKYIAPDPCIELTTPSTAKTSLPSACLSALKKLIE